MLKAQDIFNRLSEWPHRQTGSEQEFEAREALMAQLAGEVGVFTTEEGYYTPASYIPFLWTVTVTQLISLLAVNFVPLLSLVLSLLAAGSLYLFLDWRKSPAIWWWASKATANLVASKGTGQSLVIVMAHLDSAPASYAYRPNQVKKFTVTLYFTIILHALPLVYALFAASGINVSVGLLLPIQLMMFVSVIIASIDYWRFGATAGANDNLTGVAAASELASRLWADMPENTEIRLVITSSEETGMLGAQHYFTVHKEEILTRDTVVLNLDTVGSQNLRYVTQSGSFSKITYKGILQQTAGLLAGTKSFPDIHPIQHRVGDFDTVWFARAGVPCLTLASYNMDEVMPYIHTPQDVAKHVHMDTVALSVDFGEMVIRSSLAMQDTDTGR